MAIHDEQDGPNLEPITYGLPGYHYNPNYFLIISTSIDQDGFLLDIYFHNYYLNSLLDIYLQSDGFLTNGFFQICESQVPLKELRNFFFSFHQIRGELSSSMVQLKRLSQFNFMYEFLIQVDIGGHPPTQTGSHAVFILVVIFLDFRVLYFWGRFEALQNVFWACHSHTINEVKV